MAVILVSVKQIVTNIVNASIHEIGFHMLSLL